MPAIKGCIYKRNVCIRTLRPSVWKAATRFVRLITLPVLPQSSGTPAPRLQQGFDRRTSCPLPPPGSMGLAEWRSMHLPRFGALPQRLAPRFLQKQALLRRIAVQGGQRPRALCPSPSGNPGNLRPLWQSPSLQSPLQGGSGYYCPGSLLCCCDTVILHF